MPAMRGLAWHLIGFNESNVGGGSSGEGGRRHNQLPSERRARQRPLRRPFAWSVLGSGFEGAAAVFLPSGAIPGARLMSMSSFIARLIRDEDGGPLVEVAI